MDVESPKQPELVYSCCECTNWAPISAVITFHDKGSSCHFCGSECYSKWISKYKEVETDSR